MFYMVILGATVIALLGFVHAWFTLRSTPTGGPMMPIDASVKEAMSVEGGLGIAPELRTTLYKAWIGFNLSHSLGLVVVGFLIGLPVVVQASVPFDNWSWLVCALVLPWLYLWMSVRFWFAKPTQGFTLAGVLILVGTLGEWVFAL